MSDEPAREDQRSAGAAAPTPSVQAPVPPPVSEGLAHHAMFARLSDRLFGAAVVEPRVGRFVVRGLIGTGGMGRVYEAVDEDLDRRVALKVLHAGFDADQRQRLRKEAQALARLSHPNVVHVYEVGEHEGAPYVAMEHVEGSTLAVWQRASRHAWPAILEVYRQAARGLVAAHEAGIVHRDFKPGNVIVGRDGRVRVVDFGLAKAMTTASPSTSAREAEDGTTDDAFSEMLRTRTGTIVGTPAYMSPEQLLGDHAGPGSDQFSFCVALFEALFDRLPFSGADRRARVQSMLSERLIRPNAASDCPGWLWRVIRRGLQPRAEARHASMAALLDVLERTPRRRRAVWLGGLATLPLLVALWAWAPPTAERCVDALGLAGVWDDARKQDVALAFGKVGHENATDRYDAVVATLDAYAADWSLARQTACEADERRSPDDAGPPARLQCLDLRRRELLGLTSLLARADAAVVTRAPLLVAALPELESCTQIEGEQALVNVEQQASLTEARLLRAAGRFVEAHDVLETVAQAAAAPGEERLQAEARLEQGITLDRQGRHEEALERLRTAEALALAHEGPALVVDAALKIAQIQLYPFNRTDEAALGLDRVDRLVRGLPHDPARLAAWHRVRGMLATQRHQPRDAIAEHQREVALVRETSPPDPGQLAESITLLGNATADAGELERALALYLEVVELRVTAYGSDHPLLARALMNVAIVYGELGRPDDARREYERALEQLATLDDPDEHWADAATIRQGLALTLAEIAPQELERAIALARQAQAILERRLGPTDESRIDVARTLCNLYAAASMGAEALRCYQDQEHLHDSNGLPAPIWDLRVNIAQSLVEQGRTVEARRYLQDALPRVRAELGGRDARVVIPLAVVVELEELAGGDRVRARAAMEEILAEREHEAELAEIDPSLTDHVSQAIAYGAWRLALRLHAEGDHLREAQLLDDAAGRYARLDESFGGPERVEEIERQQASHRQRW